MYVYTRGHICVYEMVPAGFFMCTFDLQADTHNSAYTEEGEILYHDLCRHKSQWDYGFRTCTKADWCPWKNSSALLSALMASSPAPQLTTMAQDHSPGGWRWELAAVLILRTKDFSLCPPFLWTCLAGQSAFCDQTEWAGGDVASWYKWPFCGLSVLSFCWGPGGFSCLSVCPSLRNLSRKNDVSKLGFSWIVLLYKYRVYTHTDTHTYTNMNPQTQLECAALASNMSTHQRSRHCSCSQKVKFYIVIFKHSGKIQRVPWIKGGKKMFSKQWSTD